MTRLLQPCGTPAAYRRHLAYGQDPCEACNRANNALTAACRRKRRRSPSQIERDILELVHVLACALGVGRGPV